jgi:DNA-binding NarL/FixJ family response regulator
MRNIIVFSNIAAIQKHWSNALQEHYATKIVETLDALRVYLQKNDERDIVMIDEQSVNNIQEVLEELNTFENVDLLLFHNLPDVHHAVRLVGKNVKGYENSFIHKTNLLIMIETIENGKNWFFLDLTQHIISSYIQDNSENKQEPSFVKELTKKEREIADYIARGLSNKEIAQKEKIALSTVKGHIQNIFQKAGVNDRISLALLLR